MGLTIRIILMHLVVIATFCFLLTSCAAPAKKASDAALFSGTTSNLSAEKIEKELTRSDSLYGFWQVEAYPFTRILIEKTERELGEKNLDTNEKTEAEIRSSSSALVDNASCFLITVQTSQTIETAQFKNWRAKFEDANKQLYEVEFSKKQRYGALDVPEVFRENSSNMHWTNSSVGCTKGKQDFSKGFTLHLIPQFKSYKDNERAKLIWDIKK